MENIKTISDLTFSLAINDSQELEINNSGVSEKITIGQLKTHIASNKADVDGSNMLLDNLSSIAEDNIRLRAVPNYSSGIIISSRISFTAPAYGVIIGLVGGGNIDPGHNTQAIGLYANIERTVRLAGISYDLTINPGYNCFCIPVEKNKTYYLDGENGVCGFFPYY